jgi:hypothetical protein
VATEQRRNVATDFVVRAVKAVYCFWYAAHWALLSRVVAAEAIPPPRMQNAIALRVAHRRTVIAESMP